MLEQHVPSLETCKRMKELGWKQGYENMYVWDKGELHVVQDNYDVYHLDSNCIAAPLLSEILDTLPTLAGIDHIQTADIHPLAPSYWRATVRIDPFIERNFIHGDDKNPAEAAALLWIRLREEEVIE